MNTAAEKKPTLTLDKKIAAQELSATTQDNAQPSATSAPESNAAEVFRNAVKAIEVERTELVKKTIENIKPGKPFDSSVVREINKLETKKNRLIIARFATLLKKEPGEVQAIVHQIIEI